MWSSGRNSIVFKNEFFPKNFFWNLQYREFKKISFENEMKLIFINLFIFFISDYCLLIRYLIILIIYNENEATLSYKWDEINFLKHLKWLCLSIQNEAVCQTLFKIYIVFKKLIYFICIENRIENISFPEIRALCSYTKILLL